MKSSARRVGWTALAVTVIAAAEGYRRQAYLDPVGIPTACFGATLGIKMGMTFTAAQCEGLLLRDLEAAEAVVDRCIAVPLNDGQRAALVSFAYNVGPGRKGGKDGLCVLKSGRQPQIRQRFNRGDHEGGCRALAEGWNTAHGVVLPGLTKRRAAEQHLCLTGEVK